SCIYHHQPLSPSSLTHHLLLLFFSNDTPPTEIYPLSLHDALPISGNTLDFRPLDSATNSPGIEQLAWFAAYSAANNRGVAWAKRSEEHSSELQSRGHLVCRLLLEKKNLIGGSQSATRSLPPGGASV